MFVIRLALLISVSCSLRFMTVEYIPKHTDPVSSKKWKSSRVGRSPDKIFPGLPWPILGTHQRLTTRIWYVKKLLTIFL